MQDNNGRSQFKRRTESSRQIKMEGADKVCSAHPSASSTRNPLSKVSSYFLACHKDHVDGNETSPHVMQRNNDKRIAGHYSVSPISFCRTSPHFCSLLISIVGATEKGCPLRMHTAVVRRSIHLSKWKSPMDQKRIVGAFMSTKKLVGICLASPKLIGKKMSV